MRFQRIINALFGSVACKFVFLSQLNSNISWWSLKFHPNIPNLKSYIGTFMTKDPIVKINDNNWNNYFSGFFPQKHKATSCKLEYKKKLFLDHFVGKN